MLNRTVNIAPFALLAAALSCGPEHSTFESGTAPDALVSGVDLVPTGITVTATGTNRIRVNYSVRNDGLVAAGAFQTRIVLGTGDGTCANPDWSLECGTTVASLGSGLSVSLVGDCAVPPQVVPGPYPVRVIADSFDEIIEANETNNTQTSAPTSLGVDLVSTVSIVGPYPLLDGISLDYSVTNRATTASGPFILRFFLSKDRIFDAQDAALGCDKAIADLAGAATTSASSMTCAVPAGVTPGVYYVLAFPDYNGAVPEVIESNNVGASTTTVSAGAADLTASLATNWNYLSTDTVKFFLTVQNMGTKNAPASTLTFYASQDGFLDASDTAMCSAPIAAIPAGFSGWAGVAVSAICTLPAARSGMQSVIAVFDSGGVVVEANEANTISSQLPLGPDLRMARLSAVPVGANLAINYAVSNEGLRAAGASRVDFLIRKSDSTRVALCSVALGSTLPKARSTYTYEGAIPPSYVQCAVPVGVSLTGASIVAQADAGSAVVELDEANERIGVISATAGDLVSGAITRRYDSFLNWWYPTITITNTAATAASFYVNFYQSVDGVMDRGDTAASGCLTYKTVPAGSSITFEGYGCSVAAGTHYLIAVIDEMEWIVESDERNNYSAVFLQ